MGREHIKNPYGCVFSISPCEISGLCWFFACRSFVFAEPLCWHWVCSLLLVILFWGRPFLCFIPNRVSLLCKCICWISRLALPLYNYHGNPAGMEGGSNPRQECHRFPQFLPVVLWFFMVSTSSFVLCFWSISRALKWLSWQFSLLGAFWEEHLLIYLFHHTWTLLPSSLTVH